MTENPRPGDKTDAPRQTLRGLSGWRGRRNVLRGALTVAITLGVLVVLIRRTDASAIADAAGRLPVDAWIAALAIAAVFPLLSTTRWWLAIRAAGGPQPWRLLLRAYLGICPVNLISPSKSGDLLRALALNGRVASARVFASLLVERALDVGVLCLLTLAGGLLSGRWDILWISLLVILAIAAVLAVALTISQVFFGARMMARFAGFSEALAGFLARPGLLAAVAALTVIHWLLVGVLVTVLLSGSEAGMADTIAAMPTAILIGMIPVTIAGMGTREAAMLLLFSTVAEPSQILAAGMLYTVLVYFLPALAGLAFTRSVLRFGGSDAPPPSPATGLKV